jgi:hypothetical protein
MLLQLLHCAYHDVLQPQRKRQNDLNSEALIRTGLWPVWTGQKKRLHKAGVKLLRQVSYRQETYRAVISL